MPDPESAALGLSCCFGRTRSCSAARPPCGASPQRQFQHPTASVGEALDEVDVASGVHRHLAGP